jgi:4-amino-4-deoxy-L-arabinose transferase-like glycosyltransferase
LSGIRSTRVAAFALPLAAATLAALLRLDAITQSYGPVERPAWLHATQVRWNAMLGAVRPAGLTWGRIGTYPHRDGPPTQYISDPYTYLIFAREMRSFYRAHHREPVFPFATKVWLWLLSNQDVAVSFASASFSVLLVLATYWLGAELSSRWVGFAAAIAMAIEYDAITWAIGGWRDDAFACGVVICVCAMLGYLRSSSRNTAILLGVCGGLTCLTRLTALTFLVPGLAYLLAVGKAPFKARAQGMLLAVLALLAVIGPFAFNCWRTYGDPFYAINHLTGDQLVMEASQGGAPIGVAPGSSTSAATYVMAKAAGRPFRMLETVALGLSAYPFSNKWSGFDRWLPFLGDLVSWAALAGLVLLAGSVPGRLVLLVLVSSLVPAAVTWRLASDWRFTVHAYPFFLVAAFLAIRAAAGVATPSRIRERWAERRPSLRFGLFWAISVACAVAAVWFVTRSLPFLVVGESLSAHEEVTIGLRDRDAGFFLEGWSEPAAGNVALRTAMGSVASIQLPLPAEGDYLLTLRLDPSPRPAASEPFRAPVIRIFMNSTLISAFEPGWNPERVGMYQVRVPQTSVRRGINRLTFMTDASAPAEPGGPARRTFAIWYVRIKRAE